MACLRIGTATALLLLSCSAMDINVRSSLTFDAANTKIGPVQKVITLLKDMLKQMEKEGEADEEIYDKMACWCETNDREKTKAIADAEAKINDLTSMIEELTGTSARLNTEIKNLHKDIEKDQQALDQADAMRQKELAEFNDEEKDSIEAISALKNAITVLSKHHTALQQRDVVATLQYQMDKHV